MSLKGILPSGTLRASARRSVPLTSQGAAGLLLDVSPVWGEDWRLFFVNTHFSVLGGVDGRRDNLAELVHFMQGFIAGRGQLLPRN